MKKVKEINTRKGDRMAFVTIEDLEGIVEGTVFADVYAASRDIINSGEPLIFAGTRDGDLESPKILVNEIHKLKDSPRYFSKELQIKFSTTGIDPIQIQQLKRILEKHRGKIPVKLHIVIPNRY